MKPGPTLAVRPAQTGVNAAVVGYAAVGVAVEELPALRAALPSSFPTPLPPAFLKHADDQTVVGLAAVFQAIERGDLQTASFTDWGVLAAPRFLGRAVVAVAVQRFQEEGAWGVSPHLIPHRSLHSLSGTISQALQIHGPNLGVGGGPNAAGEAMIAAATFLPEGRVPGLWVVLTCWDPEPTLVRGTQPGAEIAFSASSTCVGVALALTLEVENWTGPRLRVVPALPPRTTPASFLREPPAPLLTTESLREAFASSQRTALTWQLEGSGLVEWKGECRDD